MPLGELAQRVIARCPGVAIPTLGSVRESISQEQTIEDIAQDVAVAMLLAVRRGALLAAAPCIYAWLVTVVRRVAIDAARRVALLALVARPTDDESSNCEPAVATTGQSGSALDPERTNLRSLLEENSGLIQHFTNAELAVVRLWASGLQGKLIAAMLGINAGAVRLRLMRARRRLWALTNA